MPRNRRDVIPLTPDNVQKFRRHLVPLLPLLRSLGGKLLIPDVRLYTTLTYNTTLNTVGTRYHLLEQFLHAPKHEIQTITNITNIDTLNPSDALGS